MVCWWQPTLQYWMRKLTWEQSSGATAGRRHRLQTTLASSVEKVQNCNANSRKHVMRNALLVSRSQLPHSVAPTWGSETSQEGWIGGADCHMGTVEDLVLVEQAGLVVICCSFVVTTKSDYPWTSAAGLASKAAASFIALCCWRMPSILLKELITKDLCAESIPTVMGCIRTQLQDRKFQNEVDNDFYWTSS